MSRTTAANPQRVVVYLTINEYDTLLDEYAQSESVDSREVYGNNHPLSEYVRQVLGNNPESDVRGYDGTPPSSREYSQTITIEFPPEQVANLKEQFKATPIADDVNARGAYGGNSPFAEYLRRCIQYHLNHVE